MARYIASVETAWEREAAFGFLADFSNASEWDPSVPRARSLSADPLAVGARFEVAFEMFGRVSELTYETIEIEAPRRLLLRSELPTAVSLDEMSFDIRPGGGTIVTYDADVQFKGPARLLDLPFRLLFARIGDKARDGMRERLALPQPAARIGSA
jgi:hypothetical protein